MSQKGAREVTAYQRAVSFLGRRDRTEDELREALRTRGHEEPEIEVACGRLRRMGFLDDAGLAERFTRSGVQHRGLGRGRIRASLASRGVAAPALERGMADALADVSEGEALEAVARKYWRARSRDTPQRRLQKLFAFLLRRGFAPALVRERLHALWPQWKDAIETPDP
jgi:regulatory protein